MTFFTSATKFINNLSGEKCVTLHL